MRTSIRNNASFKQRRQLLALLIAVILIAVQYNAAKISAGPVTTESTLVLETSGAPVLPGTIQLVHNEPGNEIGAAVDCDVTSYTYDNFLGSSTVHYQDLSTGVDNVIPGNEVDLLSDISGSRVAYTESAFTGDTVRIFDTISHTTTIVPGLWNSNPSIGGNLVAFDDRSSLSNWEQSEIATYDLSTGTVTLLTNDSLNNRNPDVSPNGDVVVWEKCQTNGLGCDIYAAIQTSPGVFTTRALTTGGGEDRFASTNGKVAVYFSNRTGENDIYYQPLTGGTEVHLSIAGEQRYATISGDFISFDSREQNGYDIFVYDIRSGKLFQATKSLGDEYYNDSGVCGDTGRIVYLNPGMGSFDLYAFTFQVPSVPSETEDQLNDLIALIRSFNLPPGIANSLMRKLQNALDAVNASDTATTCNLLSAFVNECHAQSGKKLTPDQSAQLINSANQIKTDLGCQ